MNTDSLMPDYINEWKAEHQSIINALKESSQLDIYSQNGKNKLSTLKDLLLHHLAMEDRRLYPILRITAEKNENLKRTMDFFAKDLEKITKNVTAFFGKYQNEPSSTDIPSEFGKIEAKLKDRIWREENILLQEYQKIFLSL